MQNNHLADRIKDLETVLIESGYFEHLLTGATPPSRNHAFTLSQSLRSMEQAARAPQEALTAVAQFLQERVVAEGNHLLHRLRRPEEIEEFSDFLGKLRTALRDFRTDREFVSLYGDVLSLYVLSLFKSASPGRESPIIRQILKNIARRKAVELSPVRFGQALEKVRKAITVAIIAKRYAVYVLATRGLRVLFRAELPFKAYGTSPETLALQITNLLLKNHARLSEVTDIVCGGGDLGTLPDGIYVLTEKVKDESWKRLHNSSLNRGALVAWELKELLRTQSEKGLVNASLCSPLSFCTLDSHDLSFFYASDSAQLNQSLKGHVKVTPLKSIAALLSEQEQINQQNLNILVMSLDELFASVARKTGPRIVREMAAQEANKVLIDFDFGKIVQALENENFVIPQHFRLSSREMGTGVKEICELLMIVDSGKISPPLARNLTYVVDCYARKVDMVLEMASAGMPHERPHFIILTSMMAHDPYFQALFHKIRPMIDNPFVPVLCLDSFEHEYLIADHLFEVYVNPAERERRLNYFVEERSMRHALQGPVHGAQALLDLILRLLLGFLGERGEVGVRPGVRADGMSGGGHLAQDLRIIRGMLADREEGGADALVCQRLEDGRGGRPRSVVKGEHNLVVAQEVEFLEVLKAKTRPASGVDLDNPSDAERVRIGARRFCRRGGRSRRRRSRRCRRCGRLGGGSLRPGDVRRA
jgi:hypothetical protein